MSHRFLSTKSLAVSSLVLIAGGLVAAGCGSEDKDPPSTDDEMLNPGGNNEGNGNGGTGGASSQPGNPVAPGNNGGSQSSNEGQGGSVPVDPNNPPMTNGGSGNTGEPPVNPPVGAAPNCNPAEGNVPDLTLELVADGLNQPLYVTGVPGDDSRLFVVEKAGAVRVIVNGELQQAPFMNISGQVMNQGERGLLGLAFHPNYAENGLFYLHWSSNQGATSGDGIVAEFSRDANNANAGNPGSQRNLIVFDDPEGNHNGGDLQFGPDGFLYIGMGDGGGANDQHGAVGNGQNLNTLFGKMLRIDPTGRANGAYTIPPANFAEATGQQALPEIWASGLRNPWRFSFDACTGDIYVGDVGEAQREEVDFEPRNTPGRDYGWRSLEGTLCFTDAGTCDPRGLTPPVVEHEHSEGSCSVIGGYVYRGERIAGLRGTYLYTDFCTGNFETLRIVNGQAVDRREITFDINPGNVTTFTSFGVDNSGELYVVTYVGTVYRIDPD